MPAFDTAVDLKPGAVNHAADGFHLFRGQIEVSRVFSNKGHAPVHVHFGVPGARSDGIALLLDITGVVEKGSQKKIGRHSFGKKPLAEIPAVDEAGGGQENVQGMVQVVVFRITTPVSGKVTSEKLLNSAEGVCHRRKGLRIVEKSVKVFNTVENRVGITVIKKLGKLDSWMFTHKRIFLFFCYGLFRYDLLLTILTNFP
jgi:hypothetical protein